MKQTSRPPNVFNFKVYLRLHQYISVLVRVSLAGIKQLGEERAHFLHLSGHIHHWGKLERRHKAGQIDGGRSHGEYWLILNMLNFHLPLE